MAWARSDDHDHEGAWPVDPLDALELDVAGCAGAADPCERSGPVGVGSEPGHRVGKVMDHLVGADDADVGVRHQGQLAPALVGPVVEDDRAGRGDSDGRAGDDGVVMAASKQERWTGAPRADTRRR